MTRVEGCKNSTYHGNGEKMWNVNGNVNRIVGAKKLKYKILWYMTVACCQCLIEIVILDIVVLLNLRYHDQVVGFKANMSKYDEYREWVGYNIGFHYDVICRWPLSYFSHHNQNTC